MYNNELECIEYLLNYANSSETIDFDPNQISETSHKKIFYLSVINDIIINSKADIDDIIYQFLADGTITNLFTSKTTPPKKDLHYLNDYKELYKRIIQCLKDDNYLIDIEDNSVIVAGNGIETTLPCEWLLRLSKTLKNASTKELIIYNKKNSSHIDTEEELDNYLYTSKTLLVSKANIDKTSQLENELRKVFANYKQVKTNEILKQLRERHPEFEFTNFIMPQNEIIKDIILKDKDFYKKTFKEQKNTIKKAINSYLNSVSLSFENLSSTILSDSLGNKLNKDKKSLTISLVCTYLKLLKNYNLDFYSIPMGGFKIREYITPELEECQIKLSEYLKKNTKKDYKFDLEVQELQNKIEELKEETTLEIAFENQLLLSKLIEVIDEGQIYYNIYKDQKIIFQKDSKKTGKPIFKVDVSIEELLLFIENINYIILCPGPKKELI